MPRLTKKEKAQIEFERVADILDIDVCFFHDTDKQTPYEDDGSLHIIKDGIRACYNVSNGQSNTAIYQNSNTANILHKLDIEFDDARVYVDDEEDCDYCSECGREY